jgi:hypothetical protein
MLLNANFLLIFFSDLQNSRGASQIFPRCLAGSSYYGRPERHKGELRYLKALQAEGNSDYRQAKQRAQRRHFHSKGKPAYNQPYDIQYQRARAAAVPNLPAKREKRQRREFEALRSDWDSYNGDAPQKPGEHPAKAHDASAEREPY